jgi:hypothetical protein
MTDALAIPVAGGPIHGRIRPPGSKSLTNRALVCAALARGTSTLTGCLDSQDTRVMAAGLQAKGGNADRTEAIRLASKALTDDPNYVLDSYRKEQLWGERLRNATRILLALPELKSIVDRANSNATPPGQKTEGP